MIVRGIVSNGGWTAIGSGDLLVRISVSETNSERVTPASLRGRDAVLVLGDPPELPPGFYELSKPEAVTPGEGDDAQTVDAGTTPLMVAETTNA